MQPAPRPLDVEFLLSQAGWMRGMARALVGSADAADDVVQEAWLAALLHPPRVAESAAAVRAWLAALVRNLGRRQLRARERRERREGRAARPEALEPETDVAERMQLQHCVAAAIAELEEPYRTVLVLRYVDGLTLREVAARQACTHDAARKRVSRAVSILRARLDDGYGRREAWSAVALAFVRAPGAGLVPAGVLVMVQSKFALAVVAAAVLALVFVVGRSASSARAPHAEFPSVMRAPLAVRVEPLTAARSVAESTSAPNPRRAVGAAPEAASDARLSGIVLDATGRGVPGVRVELATPKRGDLRLLDAAQAAPEWTAEQTTGADGRFALDVPPRRPLRVHARHPVAGSATLEGRYGGEELALVLTRGASVAGTVTAAADGAPLGSVRVDARVQSDDDLDRLRASARTTTASDGSYRIADLPPGRLVLRFDPPERAALAYEEADLAAGAELRIDAELDEGVTLRGIVLDAATRAPIAGAEVGAGHGLAHAVRSDAAGRFELANFAAEAFATVGARAAGYGFASVLAVEQGRRGFPPSAPRVRAELVIELAPPRSVLGRVVDPSGAALAGVYVAAVSSDFDEASTQHLAWDTAVTDARGEFALASLGAALHHSLLLRKTGYGTRVLDLPEGPGRLALGELVLAPGRVLAGTVVDAHGGALGDACVQLSGADARRGALGAPANVFVDDYLASRRAASDGRGRFFFADLAAGSYTVEVRDADDDPVASATVEVLPASDPAPVVLAVPDALGIAGTVRDAAGRALAGVVVMALAEESDAARRETRTGAEGSFALGGLAPGTHRLVFLPLADDASAACALAGVAAGSAALDVQLPRAAAIRGRAAERHGSAPLRVAAFDARGNLVAASDVAPDGAFELRVAEAERVDVAVMRAEDWQPLRPDENVVAGVRAGTDGLELVLER